MNEGDTLALSIEGLVSRGEVSALATECRAVFFIAKDVIA
jgi:hypothetical protein